MNLYKSVREQMQAHGIVQPGDRVLAAVSGGADSVCLLYILARCREDLGFTLRAAHIHHGLRETAERDCAFTEDLCRQLGIPCSVRRVDAGAYAAARGLGIEEAARLLRYQALEEICVDWERLEPGTPVRIAAAHHREDQAETVLYHLCRGTGLAGAAGMRPVNGRVIRPLLFCSRQEIEEDLRARGSTWCTDETNEDLRYTRNRIRKEILPALEACINSGAGAHLARFAGEASEIEDYLRDKTEETRGQCLADENSPEQLRLEKDGQILTEFDTERLSREPVLMQRRVLHEALTRAAGSRKDLAFVHVEAMRALLEKGGAACADLPAGLRAVKTGNRRRDLCPLSPDDYTVRILSEEETALLLERETGGSVRGSTGGAAEGDGALCLPENLYTKWFDYDKISSLPAFRARLPGDRIGIRSDEEGIRHKSLQRCMIDGKIPAEIRDRLILPAVGREILWLPGCRIHEDYKVTGKTRRILELRLAEEHR